MAYGPGWKQLQISSPNVSGLLSTAQDGINKAGAAAQNILASYDEGQKAKFDAEVAQELAGIDTQEELEAWFNNGGLNGRNVSQGMLENLMGQQGTVLGYAQDRQGMQIAGDQNQRAWNADGRAAAAEGRRSTLFDQQQTEYAEGREREAWLRDNSGAFLDAERGALTNGTRFSAHIDRTESGGSGDQYDTLFGHRNRQNGVRVSQMTIGEAGRFASPNGEYGQSVNAEIGRVATPMGKFQIVGSTLRGLQRDLGLPDDVPFSAPVQEQLGLYLAQQRVSGPRSREAARAGLRAEWEGFKNVSDSELDAMIDEIRSMPTVTRDSIMAAAAGSPPPQGQNGPRAGQAPVQDPLAPPQDRGFGGDAFAQSMAASGLFTPGQIQATVDPLREAARLGDQMNEEQRTSLQADVLAGLTRDIADSEKATDLASAERALNETLLSTGLFSEAEAADAASQGVAAIQGSPDMASALSPETSPDVRFANIIEGTEQDIQTALQSTPQGRIMSDVAAFRDDPTEGLVAALGIGGDGEDPGGLGGLLGAESGFDKNQLRNLINAYAQDNKVPAAVAAAAMREAFVRDPLGRNTLANRFPATRVSELIDEHMSQENITEFRDSQRQQREYEQELNTLNDEVRELQAAAGKPGISQDRRNAISARIAEIYSEMSLIRRQAQDLYRGGDNSGQS